jgi:ribosomal protein L29
MAKTKKSQTQDKPSLGAPELKKEILTALDKRAKLEFQHQPKMNAGLKNPLELRHLRREIARLKTFLRMKETAK